MKFLLTGALFALCSLFASAQSGGIRVNANYLLSQTPVFGLGYECQLDSTTFSFSLGLEGGQYQLLEQSALFSAIDGESVVGLALLPEARYYKGDKDFGGHFGFFGNLFCRLGRFETMRQSGVLATDAGFEISSPEIISSRYSRYQLGSGIGYRSGCHANKLHLEAMLGYYWLGKAPIESGGTRSTQERMNINAQKVRVELNLVILL
jgi:hypothetical protein